MFRCGSLEQTTSRKSSFTCSFLFLMFCKSLVERRHGQLYHPAIYLSFPPSLVRALSLLLSALPNHCLYSCLSPLQQKPLSRESQTHAFTHEHIHFPPRVKHGAKGHNVSLCRLLFNGNIYSSKKYQNFTTMVQTGWVRLLNCKNPVLPQGLSSSEQTSPCAARKCWASTPVWGNHEIE